MVSANVGSVKKFGDMRWLYSFAVKDANALIAQFAEDDVAAGVVGASLSGGGGNLARVGVSSDNEYYVNFCGHHSRWGWLPGLDSCPSPHTSGLAVGTPPIHPRALALRRWPTMLERRKSCRSRS